MINGIVKWASLNLASVVSFAQVIIKFVKELLTLVVNILFPIIPDGAFETIVLKVREIVNKVDEYVETFKQKFLK